MTVLRSTGYAGTGCDPTSNAQRHALWMARRESWIADQPDPLVAEVERGRQHAKGVALQKAMRKRKRVKLAKPRKSKPVTTNVVALPKRRTA